MTRNFLIGVGGTGARVAEAMLHCCAAGLGPDRLVILLVDPDEGNGNLSRTKNLLQTYRACRDGIRQRVGPNVRAFHTDVIAPEPFVWTIFKKQNQTLADHVGYETLQAKEPDLGHLVSLLFSNSELKTPLDQGFRGHPSIGAVVMAGPNMEEEPWRTFWAEVAECRASEARVMLVGSIFGGTGAAGVPTFGAREMLKFNPRAAISQTESRMHLGAGLVLPYFSVRADGSEADEPMFVTSDDFPIATKAALQYYDEKDLGFDQMYLIGDSLAAKVGTFSTGSQSQKNRAHYIELVSTLASLDFYRRPLPPDSSEPQYFAAARKNALVDWESLPVSSELERIQEIQADVKRRLVAFATFAYAWRGYLSSVRGSSRAEQRALPWLREHFAGDAGSDSVEPAAISAFCDRYLQWVSEVDEPSTHLIDRSKVWTDDKSEKLAVPAEYPRSIASLTKGTSDARTIDDFVTGLNGVTLGGLNLAPGERMVNLLYLASLAFCDAAPGAGRKA